VSVVEPTIVALVSRLLSVGFSAPDEQVVEQLRRLTALAGRTVGEPGLAECLADLERALDGHDLVEELGPAYEELFGGAVRCPPYEGSYEADPMRSSREMADVAGFYRAFGAVAGGPAAERPDHAACELEFLSFLAARRLEAESAGEAEQAAVCREAEDAFMLDHAGRWLPSFCRKVAREASCDVYRLLALAGERFVVAELARRGLEPAPLRARRARTAVESDEVACGVDLAR
jgi:putative dimethyl sulfoxide reductase chaperone